MLTILSAKTPRRQDAKNRPNGGEAPEGRLGLGALGVLALLALKSSETPPYEAGPAGGRFSGLPPRSAAAGAGVDGAPFIARSERPWPSATSRTWSRARATRPSG